jgi:hypothetical protein
MHDGEAAAQATTRRASFPAQAGRPLRGWLHAPMRQGSGSAAACTAAKLRGGVAHSRPDRMLHIVLEGCGVEVFGVGVVGQHRA